MHAHQYSNNVHGKVCYKGKLIYEIGIVSTLPWFTRMKYIPQGSASNRFEHTNDRIMKRVNRSAYLKICLQCITFATTIKGAEFLMLSPVQVSYRA